MPKQRRRTQEQKDAAIRAHALMAEAVRESRGEEARGCTRAWRSCSSRSDIWRSRSSACKVKSMI
jgi:hypothetical protein